MSIHELEDKLFDEWSRNRDDFVSDGVVSEVDYLSSEMKLCFVLKEVNDPSGGGWDLRDFIREGARSQTFDNMVRWVRCIRNSGDELNWGDLDVVTKELRVEVLKTICAMNLKKYPGTHTSDRAKLESAVEEDKSFIKRQYEIYCPDITICCGAGWNLRVALDLTHGGVFETTRGIKWFLNHNNKPVIIFAHPEARVQNSLIVYGLSDAVREIMHK